MPCDDHHVINMFTLCDKHPSNDLLSPCEISRPLRELMQKLQ